MPVRALPRCFAPDEAHGPYLSAVNDGAAFRLPSGTPAMGGDAPARIPFDPAGPTIQFQERRRRTTRNAAQGAEFP